MAQRTKANSWRGIARHSFKLWRIWPKSEGASVDDVATDRSGAPRNDSLCTTIRKDLDQNISG